MGTSCPVFLRILINWARNSHGSGGGKSSSWWHSHQAERMGQDGNGSIQVLVVQPRHWRDSHKNPPLLVEDYCLLYHLLLLPGWLLGSLSHGLLSDYAVRMENNFKKYYNIVDDGHPLELCGENTLRKEGDPACQFDMAQLGDCQNSPYGFVTEGEEGNINPCIFLKLNKIYGWEPTPLTWETIEKYPSDYEDMTDELKEIIKNTEDPDQIWMDCKGRYAADKEVLDMDFFPESQGIPIKYFPFQGGKYEPPLVAVRLNMNQDNTPTGQLIHVQCKAWFEGVKHASREKAGMVMFEVILNEIEPRCAEC